MTTKTLLPLQKEERIWLMDALRGFAILGIFIANLGPGFSFYNHSENNTGPYFSSFDDEMSFLHVMFIEGKFYSIFSFLFGWGIAIQLQRTSTSIVWRRLVFMFLLGLAHIILLWPGDIVAFYAFVAVLLMWMRNLKSKTMLISAIVLVLSPILLYYIKMKWEMAMAPSGILWTTGMKVGTALTGIKSEEEFQHYIRTMDYFDMVKSNIAGFFFRFGDLFFQSRIVKVLGMFLVGYLMGRNLNYKNIISNRRLLWIIVVAGLVIGLPANYLLARYVETDGGAYYNLRMQGWYRTICYAIGVAPLACSYISLFFLASHSKPGGKLLSFLQPAGKMAFSNYILQSVVGTLTFMPFGFNLIGQVGPVYYTIFAFIVFIIQVLLSKLWLSYFEFGPVEWAWRSATYGRWQRFSKNRSKKEARPLNNDL